VAKPIACSQAYPTTRFDPDRNHDCVDDDFDCLGRDELLRNDLANLTLDPRPYTEATNPTGFLEIVEGANNDAANSGVSATNFVGDIDDSIGMTVRSAEGRRFRGVFNGNAVESTVAEVWYFTSLNDLASNSVIAAVPGAVQVEDSVRLHRRVLLIRPNLTGVGRINQTLDQVNTFVANNDISVRIVPDESGTFSIVANTLADLALRSNRFSHATGAFPNSPTAALAIARLKPNGEDILLSDVAGFDVRVYSPNAQVRYTNGILLEPGDPGYVGGTGGVELGGFVDLGFGFDSGGVAIAGVDTAGEWFAALSSTTPLLNRVYDTWSPLYERDGIDQDNDGMTDEGTNGLNNGGSSTAPDDDGERETRPPYPYPIRGIQITTRIFEKTTLQVQQSSVIQSYVPE